MTNTNETAEPSGASAGSQPVAWVAFATDGSETSAVYSLYEQARAAADEWNWDVAPLYARPTLTDEEQEAIRVARKCLLPCHDDFDATLGGLLERMGLRTRKISGSRPLT